MNEQHTGLPLPHGYPFLLLDRIVEVVPGVSAVATKNLTRSDPLLDADGCLPATLLAEAIAQCVGLAVVALQPGSSAVLARIGRFRVGSRAVVAGDQLHVRARIVRVFGATVKARGTVRVNGRIRAAGELVLQLVESGQAPSASGRGGQGMRHYLRVAIACGALTAACRARVPAPAALETGMSPDAVYAAVRRQDAQVQALRARFSTRVERDGEVRRADGVLLVKKPDRFRLRLLLPFGPTVFDYTSWDDHDCMQLPLEGKQFHDAEIAAHAPFSPADLRAVFLGTDGGLQCSAQGGAAETIVECRDREGVLARVIRVPAATRRVGQEVHFVAGQPELIMQYDDYRHVESVDLPFQISLTYPEKHVRLQITVRSYEVNPMLADELFAAPPSSSRS